MELDDIRAIIALMKENDLAVFKLEREGLKIELEAHRPVPPVISTVSHPTPTLVTGMSVSANTSPGTATDKSHYQEILSPMVGTFYRSASPDSAPYIHVGQTIQEESVVCIIEAMKVMNEIKAEMRGTIAEILVENGTPVQFGQPLFRVK